MNLLFVLVHGTFAPNSTWTQDGNSLLCAELRASFGCDHNVEILSPEWSGGNNEEAREEGSDTIATEMSEILSGTKDTFSSPDEILLICHSHGTDAGLRALKKFEYVEKVKGLVAFNSPNILTLKRDFASSIERFRKLILLILALSVVSQVLISVIQYQDRNWHNLLGAMIFTFFLAVAYVLGKKYLDRFVSQLDEAALKSRNEDFHFSFAQNNKVPVFAVNSSSDEAYNGLNFLTTLAQLPFYATHRLIGFAFIIVVPMLLFYELGLRTSNSELPNYYGSYYFWTGYRDLVGLYLNDYLVLVEDISKQLADDVRFLDWNNVALKLQLLFFRLCWWCVALSGVAALTLSYLLTVILGAVLLGYFLSFGVSKLALGVRHESILGFLTTRQAVGLTPLNSDVTFYDAAEGGSVLDHSLTHSNGEVISVVIRWMKSQLASKSVNDGQ